jgi:hypothetical protein
MRKYLEFPDGTRRELTPLTYEEFIQTRLWTGGNDTSWNQFLSKNELSDIEDFRQEALCVAQVVLIDEPERQLLFNPSGDEETWVPFVRPVESDIISGARFQNLISHVMTTVFAEYEGRLTDEKYIESAKQHMQAAIDRAGFNMTIEQCKIADMNGGLTWSFKNHG